MSSAAKVSNIPFRRGLTFEVTGQATEGASVRLPNNSVTMSQPVLAFTALLLCASAANAQYDTLWIGTADGPSTSLANTPFPTEIHRAARTQYLVSYHVLDSLGLWPNDIEGICLQVVDDDAVDPACLVDVHVTMKNESTGNLNDLIYSGLVETADVNEVNLEQGILGLNFNTSTWQWLGWGNNMDVEINWERGEAAGLNPRILLDTGLAYTSTYTIRTDQVVMGSSLTSSSPDIEMDSDNSLPVLGLLVDASTGTHERRTTGLVSIFPNPASSILEVRAPSGTRSIRISDLFRRTVLQHQWTAAMNKVDISSLPPGCYTVSTLYAEGSAGNATRFIKE